MLGDHRFDDSSTTSPPARGRNGSSASATPWPNCLARSITTKLSRAGQVDFEIFRHELEKSIWLNENTTAVRARSAALHRVHQRQRLYVVDPIDAAQGDEHHQRHRADAADSSRRRRRPREPHPPAASRSWKRPSRRTAARSTSTRHDIFELAGETPQKEALKKAADDVVACLKEYQEFLEKDVLPRADGEWRLGKEKFVKKLDLELDAGLSADEVLARRRGRLRPRPARALHHRPAALGTLLSAAAAAARQRRRASGRPSAT